MESTCSVGSVVGAGGRGRSTPKYCKSMDTLELMKFSFKPTETRESTPEHVHVSLLSIHHTSGNMFFLFFFN